MSRRTIHSPRNEVKLMSTIAAIATGGSRTALGIIRLSGPEALSAAEAMFRPRGGGRLGEKPPRTMVLGSLLDTDGTQLDQVLAVYCPAPRSFTGEDTVELNCHGSPAVLSSALRALFSIFLRKNDGIMFELF